MVSSRGRDVLIWGVMLSLPCPVLAFVHGRTSLGQHPPAGFVQVLIFDWEAFPGKYESAGAGGTESCWEEASCMGSCFPLSTELSLFPGSRPRALHSQTWAAASPWAPPSSAACNVTAQVL